MQKIRNRLILLSRIISRKMLAKLHKDDPTFKIVFHLTPGELSEYFSVSVEKAEIIYDRIHSPSLKKSVLRDQQLMTVITQLDEEFPFQYLHIPDPPFVLYCLGDITLLKEERMISVIGTRKPSHEAYEKLKYIVSPLIEYGIAIVSGLAYGIDSLAHRLTLAHNGKAIAILGSGFNYVYPKENIRLFQQITKKGLVITEYPPDRQPRKYHFPERNRLISGLSKGTLVIEATEKSGTLITVDQALEQGKEVYAVPGTPWLSQTVGCHKMIQDGAKLVMNAEDIFVDFK